MNWGYLYTPIQTGTFECGYTPAYWGYTKYECDYTPITWGYLNALSIGDMLLNAFIWHFRSHAGNAQMGTSPVGSVSTFPLAESDVCPRFTPFTNARTHAHPSHTHTHTHPPYMHTTHTPTPHTHPTHTPPPPPNPHTFHPHLHTPSPPNEDRNCETSNRGHKVSAVSQHTVDILWHGTINRGTYSIPSREVML